jgi:hypothetical protein
MTEYAYYVYDNAVYRKRADSGIPAVEEVKSKGNWLPYDGDSLAPVYFGDRITKQEAAKLWN